MRPYKQLEAIADNSPPQHSGMQLIELGMVSRGLETVLAELAAGGIDLAVAVAAAAFCRPLARGDEIGGGGEAVAAQFDRIIDEAVDYDGKRPVQ